MEVILKFYEMHLEESRVVNPLFYSDLEKYPAILDMLRREQQNQMDSFLDFMMRGVEEGYFRKGVNYKLIGHMFEALTKYMMEKRLYEAYSIEELYSNMLFVTLRGFCTEKGEVDRITTSYGFKRNSRAGSTASPVGDRWSFCKGDLKVACSVWLSFAAIRIFSPLFSQRAHLMKGEPLF